MEKRQLIVIGSIGGVVLILLLIVFGILPGLRSARPVPVSLEFWGFGDDVEVWREIILSFHEKLPHIEVTYHRFPEETYEETLVNRLAAGTGPDVFMLKNSWVTKHKDKIYPMPPGTEYSVREFQQNFVDVASQDLLTQDGQILGMPIFVDTLALFYNKDLLNAAGIASPPKDWDEGFQSHYSSYIGGCCYALRHRDGYGEERSPCSGNCFCPHHAAGRRHRGSSKRAGFFGG